ncbi:hypothetical protein N658DRAFT_424387 [Parathielavia hyrcaniae]|uniref:F-box domain-containing protein n=1 Tax=Parathielavia hyrcaniae TaxID=113614 RepID=A0AAN6Q3T5_9PEZI|nr:hypothetical protein N658DRAFT_424387 [Parathielavia hyrcaniae]
MPPAKRRRRVTDRPRPNPAIPPASGRDLLSPLSDELLVRILSLLPLQHLLAVAPVSRRFYHLASDSQLWKALYYARFVLPRAMRIPGFRDGPVGTGAGHKLHYAAGRRTLWADGRRGGDDDRGGVVLRSGREEDAPRPVNWKRQYKIRYNWARGKCAVEELRLGGERDVGGGQGRRMLVKVVEGVAVTADRDEGLRAWDLKSRSLIARAEIEIGNHGADATPSCIAVDESDFERGLLDVALGFDDGSFGVWRLLTGKKQIEQRYRHEKSTNGELIAMAFSHPYLLTATQAVLVSLYTFEVPITEPGTVQQPQESSHGKTAGSLPPPYLLTSLDSHTSRPPLALSIRRAGRTTVASVAYTFSTRRGWSIGIQDLHLNDPTSDPKAAPEVSATRIAYTTPVEAAGISHCPPTPPATPQRGGHRRSTTTDAGTPATAPATAPPPTPEPGPTTLCYTHPYLLATLPDNTLVLHLCTSNASSLSLSDGIRLWGHTSGISDAEITARGKAVSVSTRGDEMRVWELEGRTAGVGGGGGGGGSSSSSSSNTRSVEIRPWGLAQVQSQSQSQSVGGSGIDSRVESEGDGAGRVNGYPYPARDWDERRNWVGFDDEMVIVLKERRGARESLMVYDFTT